MPHECIGLCQDKEHKSSQYPDGIQTASNAEFPYERGYKYCKHCNWYILFEGRFCPCCAHKMRLGNHHTKQNKWTYETWFIMKSILWASQYMVGGKVLTIEAK